MDIVYPYRPSPEDFELRMSLRSLKHLKTPFENVWVIGEIPSCFRGKLIYQQDRMTGKQQNVIFKLLKICDDKRISEDFIVMNDDFIFTKDQELKNYQLGS